VKSTTSERCEQRCAQLCSRVMRRASNAHAGTPDIKRQAALATDASDPACPLALPAACTAASGRRLTTTTSTLEEVARSDDRQPDSRQQCRELDSLTPLQRQISRILLARNMLVPQYHRRHGQENQMNQMKQQQSGFTLVEIRHCTRHHRPAAGRRAEGPGDDQQRQGQEHDRRFPQRIQSRVRLSGPLSSLSPGDQNQGQWKPDAFGAANATALCAGAANLRAVNNGRIDGTWNAG
jgi:hypothetical protein